MSPEAERLVDSFGRQCAKYPGMTSRTFIALESFIESLEARVAELEAERRIWIERDIKAATQFAEFHELRARCAALEADARRYRWLRENIGHKVEVVKVGLLGHNYRRWYHDSPNWEETLDSAIDAARQENRKN